MLFRSRLNWRRCMKRCRPKKRPPGWKRCPNARLSKFFASSSRRRPEPSSPKCVSIAQRNSRNSYSFKPPKMPPPPGGSFLPTIREVLSSSKKSVSPAVPFAQIGVRLRRSFDGMTLEMFSRESTNIHWKGCRYDGRSTSSGRCRRHFHSAR